MRVRHSKVTSQEELPADLIEFGKREHVSIVEMVGLLGATVLFLGNKLEQAAGLDNRIKTPDMPLAQQLLNVVVTFGKRHDVSPLEMVGVLGGTLIDIAASIQSDLPGGGE
jgi:hypothetical protein